MRLCHRFLTGGPIAMQNGKNNLTLSHQSSHRFDRNVKKKHNINYCFRVLCAVIVKMFNEQLN